MSLLENTVGLAPNSDSGLDALAGLLRESGLMTDWSATFALVAAAWAEVRDWPPIRRAARPSDFSLSGCAIARGASPGAVGGVGAGADGALHMGVRVSLRKPAHSAGKGWGHETRKAP